MTAILPFARRAALASLLAGVPLAAWAQAGSDSAGTAPVPASGDSLPGTVVERNVFVPVDGSGHTGGEYIVVERRVVKKDGAAASGEVPTHFILVPQDGDDDDADSNEGGGDDGSTQ